MRFCFAELRKHLPPGKGYIRPGETTHSTNTTHTPVTALEELRPRCCTTTDSSLATLIPAFPQLRLFRPIIYAQIDTGCLLTNMISTSGVAWTRWWTDI